SLVREGERLIEKARDWEAGADRLAREIRTLVEQSSPLVRLVHWRELRALKRAEEALRHQIRSASALRLVVEALVSTLKTQRLLRGSPCRLNSLYQRLPCGSVSANTWPIPCIAWLSGTRTVCG